MLREKKVLLLLWCIVCTATSLKAQDYNWKGVRPDYSKHQVNVTTENPSDEQTVFLYNVWTKTFLNIGGHWGDEAELSKHGMPVYLHRTSGGSTYNSYGKFELLSSPVVAAKTPNKISWIYDGVSSQDEKGVFVDRLTSNEELYTGGAKTFAEWEFYRPKNSSDPNEFVICHKAKDGTWWYLQQLEGDPHAARKNIVTCTSATARPNIEDLANARWKIVTKKEMIELFKKVDDASFRHPADASFYLYNRDFSRNNGHENKWMTEVTAGEININNAKYYKKGEDQMNYKVGTNPSDTKYTSLPEGTTSYYNLMYGQFYNAEIKGIGAIAQRVRLNYNGWYRVTIQGFFSGNEDCIEKRSAKLYAKVLGYDETKPGTEFWVERKLPLITNRPDSITMPTDLTESGICFYEHPDAYTTSLLFYMPKNEANPSSGYEVEIGVYADCWDYCTFFSSDRSANNLPGEARMPHCYGCYSWTAMDNMVLEYVGLDFPIHELNDNSSMRNTEAKWSTMILTRTFVLGEWNSFFLPVDLDKRQVTTAFGNDVQIAKLNGLDASGKEIQFSSLNLAEMQPSDRVIETGQPYLIKTNVDGYNANINWTDTHKADGSTLVSGEHSYVIYGVNYNVPVSNKVERICESKATDGSTLTLHGNYVELKGEDKVKASTDNFIYVMNKGNLWRYTKDFPLKGLRFYLEFKNPQGAGARMAILDDNAETTGIRSLPVYEEKSAKRGIYNLNGQTVNATSTDALPSGIYIVDGKKTIVH